MFCINCFNKKTLVANSRAHKKQASIWRRRTCTSCKLAFTTYERPSLPDNKPVHLTDNQTEKFNLGKLVISIANAFTHNQRQAKYDALWLAQTVEDTLSTQVQQITPEEIAAVTHQTLKLYDELAAVQYAAQHQMITSVRKRGRPSFSASQPRRT